MNHFDKGPWYTTASDTIQSDDFTHDAALHITGDFEDDSARFDYATALANRLNAQATELAFLETLIRMNANDKVEAIHNRIAKLKGEQP